MCYTRVTHVLHTCYTRVYHMWYTLHLRHLPTTNVPIFTTQTPSELETVSLSVRVLSFCQVSACEALLCFGVWGSSLRVVVLSAV